MFVQQSFRLMISCLVISVPIGPAMALPLSVDSIDAPQVESKLELLSGDRQLQAAPLPMEEIISRRSGGSFGAGSTSLQAESHRQDSNPEAISDQLASFRSIEQGNLSASSQAFWRQADASRSLSSHAMPLEISESIDDFYRGMAETIGDATGMRVDSEGRRRLSIAGVDVFMGPQGGGIAINYGDVSQVLVDYDARRSNAELAMLAEHDASGNGKVSFNPLFQLIQLLKEILGYPLFWVFIVSLFVGYISLAIFKQRALKRAQDLYAIKPKPVSKDFDQPNVRSQNNKLHATSTTRTLAPTDGKVKAKVQPEQSSSSATSVPANAASTPPAVKRLPDNDSQTGSIWLKR
ncbi:MAG TPA: hypothetical protein PLB97_03785 [Accumulibacter sp.]|nr:hypothetical protein [Accumulibacter sp.]HPP46652.1 hypothetical protein [Accumulibacter sp.]